MAKHLEDVTTMREDTAALALAATQTFIDAIVKYAVDNREDYGHVSLPSKEYTAEVFRHFIGVHEALVAVGDKYIHTGSCDPDTATEPTAKILSLVDSKAPC